MVDEIRSCGVLFGFDRRVEIRMGCIVDRENSHDWCPFQFSASILQDDNGQVNDKKHDFGKNILEKF